jgi:hypothetical protein
MTWIVNLSHQDELILNPMEYVQILWNVELNKKRYIKNFRTFIEVQMKYRNFIFID